MAGRVVIVMDGGAVNAVLVSPEVQGVTVEVRDFDEGEVRYALSGETGWAIGRDELGEAFVVKPVTPELLEESEDPKVAFCSEVSLLMLKADQLGLHKTASKLDDALFQCGFEVADKLAEDKTVTLKEEGKP